VHVVVGVDHLNNLYLLDVWRGQKTADVWIEAFCDLVAEISAARMGGGDRARSSPRWAVP
jgi:hypothetical protein